jgi:tRNA threonylcarbamoyl adenosine modification protein YeaZ
MNLLAIETATETCSVALLAGDRLIARSELAPRRHAELLLPMCDEVLAEAGLARTALDVLAVGRGPGAFTGVRLAVSAVQGIALALDVPVVPISSLAALAMQAPDNGDDVLAVIDARMGEVYAGRFRRIGERVEAVDDERVCAASALRFERGDGGGDGVGAAMGRRRALSASRRRRAARDADRKIRRRRRGRSGVTRLPARQGRADTRRAASLRRSMQQQQCRKA